MVEISMSLDDRSAAQQSALDAAATDDGLRVALATALLWDRDEAPTPAAIVGGFVYDLVDRIACVVEQREQASRRQFAERVLFVSDVARGLRCPYCHGNPATQPHLLQTNPQYQCGGGHVWRRPLVTEDPSASPEVLLRRMAETGDLPPVPVRIEQETTDG